MRDREKQKLIKNIATCNSLALVKGLKYFQLIKIHMIFDFIL